LPNTIFKSNRPITGVRQLVRQNALAGKYENPIEEMDDFISNKGTIAELWLKVKEQMKSNIDIEKKKSHMEGMQASFEEAKNEVADEVKTLQSIINAFADNTINAVNSFEHSLVTLSIKIAEKVIKKKIEDEDDVVMSLVRNTLKTVKDSSEITVLLNPNDLDVFSQYEELDLYENRKIKFVTDEGVESGGCKIHTDWGIIDAQISTQLGEISAQLVARNEDESQADSEDASE